MCDNLDPETTLCPGVIDAMEPAMLQTTSSAPEADLERKARLAATLRATLVELDEMQLSAPAANYLSWAIALIEAE